MESPVTARNDIHLQAMVVNLFVAGSEPLSIKHWQRFTRRSYNDVCRLQTL